ncbi:SNF2 family N-terminal domain-containing protein [Mucidula mucida]|nr:SNF2 family N-terminal domain-containing protein [Mucidula mucida]
MPAFQAPSVATKRKSDVSDPVSRKKQSLGFSSEQYWMVQWRNHQTKKHKTWEGDGVLVIEGSRATLYGSDGKSLGSAAAPQTIEQGFECGFAGKDICLECETTKAEYLSGRCFGHASSGPSLPVSTPSTVKSYAPLKVNAAPLVSSPFHAPSMKLSAPKRGIPLEEVGLYSSSSTSPNQVKENIEIKSYWSANWRKVSKNGKGSWDGDAFVMHNNKVVTLISDTGKSIGTSAWKGTPLQRDDKLYFGSKEVQLVDQVKPSALPVDTGEPDPPEDEVLIVEDTSSVKKFATPLNTNGVAPAAFYGLAKKASGPLHDPNAKGAVVMKAPTEEHIKKWNRKNRPVVPVVLDPVVAQKLRPHQVEGVKFMYESIMGLRKHEGQGCILADEMGLGKTLQTICLVWTLLKQNPYGGNVPSVEKVLIACPVSLINNWKNEFHKWLGKDRIGISVCDKDKRAIHGFMNSKMQKVLIIGYERLRTVMDLLTSCIPPIGLIICDEGHRLKSGSNKTTQMFSALRTPRRILLSGTPIQNDLSEFHAMADFCNPGLLDDYSVFKRVYETPILKSRAPDCTRKEKEMGESRSAQLMAIAKSFVLRREATILGNYLPPKHEYVVFITPTSVQLSIFAKILHPDKLEDLVKGSTADSLALINLLTKISNSPILLKATADKAKTDGKSENLKNTSIREALSLIPDGARIEDMSLSGKLTVLSRLLAHIKTHTEEKCVIVSHYTSTLNILEAFCQKQHYSYHRLDGSTPPAKRQEYVNLFNKSSQTSGFIFLLSSKAGGVGINLIGGSRLVLIDSDWNPSHDLQAMARCHRDGQKRPVFIYRFLTAGTIDEKIFQRQITKLGLSNCSFTRKDLRDIFRIQPDTCCNTHELLECHCDNVPGSQSLPTQADDGSDDDSDSEESGFVVASQVNPKKLSKKDKEYLRERKEALAALGQWKHVNCLLSKTHNGIRDDVLREILFDEKKMPKAESLRGKSLLDALDLDNIAAMGGIRTVRDVPGGSVSFLFEKSSEDPVPVVVDEEMADTGGIDFMDIDDDDDDF